MSEHTLTATFTQMRKGFLRLAARFLPNEEDADDALQEAFCKLWPRRQQINTPQEAEALTVTTLKNLCIDKLRKERMTQVELAHWHDRDGAGRVDELLEQQEQFRHVEQLISEQLSPLQQQILRLKEYEGETIEAIAAQLTMQPTAVRMHLSRARKKIRTVYHNTLHNEKR